MANITLDVLALVLPDTTIAGQTSLLTRSVTEAMPRDRRLKAFAQVGMHCSSWNFALTNSIAAALAAQNLFPAPFLRADREQLIVSDTRRACQLNVNVCGHVGERA